MNLADTVIPYDNLIEDVLCHYISTIYLLPCMWTGNLAQLCLTIFLSFQAISFEPLQLFLSFHIHLTILSLNVCL